jgi:hypothetical protein
VPDGHPPQAEVADAVSQLGLLTVFFSPQQEALLLAASVAAQVPFWAQEVLLSPAVQAISAFSEEAALAVQGVLAGHP